MDGKYLRYFIRYEVPPGKNFYRLGAAKCYGKQDEYGKVKKGTENQCLCETVTDRYRDGQT
jgi:hypothetical protein